MQNFFTLIALVAPLISVVLAILYAYVGIQNRKQVKSESPKLRGKDEDAAYSGLSTVDFDAVEYVENNPEVCGMVNMGVTMDHRKIFVCKLIFTES